LGHGVSLSSRGSGRLVTRLDTPPSSHRHHPDSAIARVGSSRLFTAALQDYARAKASVALIDEIEHGLEPHRISRLLRELKKENVEPLEIIDSCFSNQRGYHEQRVLLARDQPDVRRRAAHHGFDGGKLFDVPNGGLGDRRFAIAGQLEKASAQ
ncbi:AAA family ATPase, partial [Bradyrhizobium sp. Mp27]